MNKDAQILQDLMNFAEKEPFSFFSINNDLDYDHSHNLSKPVLNLSGIKGSFISLELKSENIGLYSKFLKETIFKKEKKVMCYNSKPFFSYLLSKNINPNIFECSFFDLQWFFSYSGKRSIELASINDVLKNFSEITTLLSSSQNNLYKSIYGGLIKDVIPYLENNCLIDVEEEGKVYSFYKIEGQENGRLSCQTHLKKGFNPHSMGPDLKANLRPYYPHDIFMIFDYKNMEVSVLSEISQDNNLIKLLDSNKDFYETIFKIVIGGENENSRNFAKKFFLPIIYGQAPTSLSHNLGISENTAKEIINRLRKLFPKVFQFSDNAQDEAKRNGCVKDYFSRTRYFEDNYYKARNFVVQSPAALLCLEKLICLYKNLNKEESRIVFSIHDGYGVTANKLNALSLYPSIKKILESKSSLLPNCNLEISFKIGKRLNNLLELKRKETILSTG